MASKGKKRRTIDQSDPLDDLVPGGSVETSDLTSRRLLSPLAPSDPLVEIEDRRSYHPERGSRPALYSSRPRLVEKSKLPPRVARFRPSQTQARLAFSDPENVVVCVRRKDRREVLFAKRKTGRGGRRPRRRSWMSQLSCR